MYLYVYFNTFRLLVYFVHYGLNRDMQCVQNLVVYYVYKLLSLFFSLYVSILLSLYLVSELSSSLCFDRNMLEIIYNLYFAKPMFFRVTMNGHSYSDRSFMHHVRLLEVFFFYALYIYI